MTQPRYILTLSCHNQLGIVAAVAGCLAERQCNISSSAQYGDPLTGKFFMRTEFEPRTEKFNKETFKIIFDEMVAHKYGMNWTLADGGVKMPTVLLVSKEDHCLNDLLYREETGSLAVDIRVVVSNHETTRRIAEKHDKPFVHLPVSADSKSQQETKLLEVIRESGAELIVLARYMQILSERVCKELEGRAINIHHSFLPSFKGAKPYHQAHARGVKLIGATAHFVTTDLDEGPIIEQDVERVTHSETPQELVVLGRDVECRVLSRAVRYYSEHRILPNGQKTVVFR